MGSGSDVLLATYITVIVMLVAMLIAQWLVETKAPKFWYFLPLGWFLFILLYSLLDLFFQSHVGSALNIFLRFSWGTLLFSAPAMFPLAFHFIMLKKQSKQE